MICCGFVGPSYCCNVAIAFIFKVALTHLSCIRLYCKWYLNGVHNYIGYFINNVKEASNEFMTLWLVLFLHYLKEVINHFAYLRLKENWWRNRWNNRSKFSIIPMWSTNNYTRLRLSRWRWFGIYCTINKSRY